MYVLMMLDQIIIISLLVVSTAMFLWGRLRHGIVAVAMLLACVLTGVVSVNLAFTEFLYPVVITVGV